MQTQPWPLQNPTLDTASPYPTLSYSDSTLPHRIWPVLPTLPNPHMFDHLYTTTPTLPNPILPDLTLPYPIQPYPTVGASLARFPLVAVGHLCGVSLGPLNNIKITNLIWSIRHISLMKLAISKRPASNVTLILPNPHLFGIPK